MSVSNGEMPTDGTMPSLSSEEAKAAKAEIEAATEGDDEIEVDVDGGITSGSPDGTGNFHVTEDELGIIRAELASDFPDDYTYLSDAYIKSVASKPYSKDLTRRRPLAYTMEKLSHVMEWRSEAGAPHMEELVRLANGSPSSPEALNDPDRLAKAKAMATSLNYGSLYWHGLTKDGRPILWIRTGRKPWYPNVQAELDALILLADAGIRCMPEGITDFVVISDSTSPPPPNPAFMIGMLKGLVRGYPDRLNLLVSAPVSSIIQFVMNLLLPLMPGRLANKVVLLDVERMKTKLAEEILPGGKDDIPTFFGGKANHDKYYPEEAYCPNRGKGTLKFDYFGMMERLVAAKREFEERQKEEGEGKKSQE